MQRKAMKDLIEWKESHDGKPLIIYGPRQVGKTYLVREFAKMYYDNIFEVNFELDKSASIMFQGNLTVKNLMMHLSAYDIDNIILPKKTLIFFDEVQKCPDVLTALKSFAMDGRYDVIASGSMLGVTLHQVSSYPVGYVKTLYMKPLSFEEFLWANKYTEEHIKLIEEFYLKEEQVSPGLHEIFNDLFLQYIVVGGMPEAVATFVKTRNIALVAKVQKDILEDYNKDLAKYASSNVKEKVRECYKSIPDQLAMENKKFQYKQVKGSGNARYYSSSITWLEDAGLIYKVNRLKAFDIPLRAYRDVSSFKLYFVDTGLLLSMYEEDNIQSEILNGNLGIFKGALFENVIAQILISNEMPIYYYRRDDRLEIDFVTNLNNRIIPIEVKSGKNTKSISLSNIINKEELEYGIKLSMNNVNCSNSRFKCFPLYMAM
ncbi:MAG: ATP-binding protein, partial [Anaeroplasmataceae bacterium]|nr:ATP-binding protein [Anaeroplasmataceae bacterium]